MYLIQDHIRKLDAAYTGDEVEAIADHGNVMIVQAKNGRRFSVPVAKLSKTKPGTLDEAVKEASPAPKPLVPPPLKHKPVPAKQSPKVIPEQKSLF